MKETFTKKEVIEALTEANDFYEKQVKKSTTEEERKKWIGKLAALDRVAQKLGYNLLTREEIEEQ